MKHLIASIFSIFVLITLVWYLYNWNTRMEREIIELEREIREYLPKNCPPGQRYDCFGGKCAGCWERYGQELVQKMRDEGVKLP